MGFLRTLLSTAIHVVLCISLSWIWMLLLVLDSPYSMHFFVAACGYTAMRIIYIWWWYVLSLLPKRKPVGQHSASFAQTERLSLGRIVTATH